ncbi:uncharacterized protein LOC111338866 [Stylophora pistillata]|uniref:uncharacterized protein LOC111338866 n=1 Tax=Stylophora pistillata TaxID=50429 RepID=UPI000C0409D5|nr:uncharacterized protein LOC111338866 [Stylophora pistillata]
MPPLQLTAYNFTSEASIAVSWSPVPSNHINGILLGYSLKYERLQTSERQVIDVDEHMLTLRATDLSVSLQVQAYSIYRIGVAAFTRKGIGPYTEYAYAESCRCPKVLYTNFWSTSPYLKVNVEDNEMEGIFSRIVTDMIFAACGLCPGHGSSTIIKITTNGKGEYSAKKSISEVLGDIDDVPQISFPIYGNKDITRYLGAYAYINLVESPGVAFIAAKRLPGSMAKNMINAVLECIPMIMLSACVGEGLWWSFISMTTVGYGDRSPRSILARIFGIIWILTGLVVISILIGAIASSLTFITVDKPVNLYGAKIGAIQNSVEYHLGILKNAKVNEEREYNSVDEIRTAIEEGEIDGALLDTYVAAEHKETLFNDRVYVKEILDRPIGYGVVLSGAAVSVEQRCRDYINMHITEIFHIIQNMTKTLDAPAENFAMEQSTRLFDSTSEMFRIAMASLLAVLGVALLGGLSYHFLIYLPRRKRINEERTTELQCSYRKALKREMMAFVDSFYEDMSKKISSIKKELQQEILNKKARPKSTVQVDRSAESSKRDTESSLLGSCSTLSSWTSETQYEKCKQIFELVSNSGNIQLERGSQQDLQKPFPSSSGENCFSQTLPNVVISDDDVKNGDSSC